MRRLFTLIYNLIFPKQLTTSYTSNSYVSSTAFNRIRAWHVGGIVIVDMNLQVTTSLATGGGAVTIGQIDLPRNGYYSYANMQSQNKSGNLLITIQSDGTVTIQNASGSAITGFHRGTMVIVLGA